MKKTLTLILILTTLALALFVSCDNDTTIVTVTFDANGGTGEMEPQRIVADKATALSPSTFTREDYLFSGWKSDDGTHYDDEQKVEISKDVTLYAQWTRRLIRIKYDANGGIGMMADQSTLSGLATTLNANTYSNGDMHFESWNTEADGYGTRYADKEQIVLKEDVTLYAQWVAWVELEADMTEWEDGKTYTLSSDLTIPGRVNVTGVVTLVLPAGCTLTCPKGIGVNKGNTLVIRSPDEATGKLIAGSEGNWGQPGIGSTYVEGKRSEMGTLVIDGGIIEATGGERAAGIGGSCDGDGGHVYIMGGEVTATATAWGAGIGGGKDCSGCTLYIMGGKVKAVGEKSGQGIGLGGGGSAGQARLYLFGGQVYAAGAAAFDTYCELHNGMALLESSSGKEGEWHPYTPEFRKSQYFVKSTNWE